MHGWVWLPCPREALARESCLTGRGRYARLCMNYLALATDYDGTLARDGHVDEATLESLGRLKSSGRKVLLVTGRELPELKGVCPQYGAFDAIVAENGGVLYWPAEDKEEVLGEAPPAEFLQQIQERGVSPYSVGRVVFATWRPHEFAVLEILQQLGLGHQIIFNKRAVMVLPSGISKASGLGRALDALRIPAGQVVGVGDAENDHAFLEICGVAAAVSNGLAGLRQRCDLVTEGDHGDGVRELIERLLADDLQSLGVRRPRQMLHSGASEAR